MGLLILFHRPDHPIGWIYLAIGLSESLAFFSFAYATYESIREPGALPGSGFMAWLSGWVWALGVGLVATFLFLLFPDGHLPSRRWRPVAWAAGMGLFLILLAGLFLLTEPDRMLDEELAPEGPAALLFIGGLAVLGATMMACVASLFVRFRRAKGEERQQLKWFMLAGLLSTGGLALEISGYEVKWFDLRYVIDGALYSIPVATVIVILKYRLYDIDVIINRALVYGSLSAILGFAYISGAVVVGGAVRSITGQTSNNFAVAASALAVAALFRPARSRIQSFIDRRFYRRRYDAAQTLESFSAGLRDEVELGALTAHLLTAVRDTMQPAQVSLWLRTPEQTR